MPTVAVIYGVISDFVCFQPNQYRLFVKEKLDFWSRTALQMPSSHQSKKVTLQYLIRVDSFLNNQVTYKNMQMSCSPSIQAAHNIQSLTFGEQLSHTRTQFGFEDFTKQSRLDKLTIHLRCDKLDPILTILDRFT